MNLNFYCSVKSFSLFLFPSMALGYCYEPSEPNIPSGYFADFDEIKSAESNVEDFISEVEDYVECLTKKVREKNGAVNDLEDDIDDLEDDIDDLEDEINDADRLKSNIISEWNDAVANFGNSQ